MFKNKKKASTNTSQTTSIPSGSTNSLVEGSRVEGIIIANSDIRIDGTLVGSLDCSGRVIIGATGEIEGDVKCQNAVIEGKFTGKINVTELLNVRENASIQGDVITAKLLVQPGAIYNVNCSMAGQTIQGFAADND
ncbi:MAG: polymer-forming cytoskeletal protein [Saprospiraceae bacterium]